MVRRFAWIAVFVLLAAPVLGQSAVFDDDFAGALVKSDFGGAYEHCTNCSFVTIDRTGNFFLRSSCCFCLVNCDFRGACDGEPGPENCPGSGRSIKIELPRGLPIELPSPHPVCGEYCYPDVMVSARQMFAKPKRGAVFTNVRIVFSPTGLPEPPDAKWYKLQYTQDIPVRIDDEETRTLEVTVKDDLAAADLYWYNESGKRPKWEKIAIDLKVPFMLTVHRPN